MIKINNLRIIQTNQIHQTSLLETRNQVLLLVKAAKILQKKETANPNKKNNCKKYKNLV